MYQEPINITKEIEKYFEIEDEVLAMREIGNNPMAGEISIELTKLHSKIASYIFFYKDDSSSARNLVAQFFKKAKPYRILFPRKFKNGQIDNSHESIRCKCNIYNDPSGGNVKICIENGPDNVISGVEGHYENGNLSDAGGEEPVMSFTVDRFRDAGEDTNSIPFNQTGERIIRSHGLVPAYWSDGNIHRNHWFLDGITHDEAKRLLKDGPGNNKGGKYEYISYSLVGEKKENKKEVILEMIDRMNKVIF